MAVRISFLLTWLALLLAGLPALADDEAGVKRERIEDKTAGADKAEAASGPSKFMRLRRDEDGRLQSMDTAIVRFAPANGKHPGLVVDLISAVHVGEKSYYQQLNKEFEQYDALLYELVAPAGTRVPEGGAAGEGGVIASLQQGLKDVLNLEYQLEIVNYQKDNFVHADMSPEEFLKSMSDRGESLWTMFLRAMEQASAQQQNDSGSPELRILLSLMFNKDKTLAIKRIMAQQLEDVETAVKIFDGPDGSTIITERNKKALEVLSQQIAAGKKKIGIFYGGGHLPDMEQRLISDFGLKRQGERWVVAWNLRSSE
jgi:hypothetical protein